MPRGPVDRPTWSAEPYLEIRAVIDRALLQGAAPVAAGRPPAVPEAFGSAVAETAAARPVQAVPRSKPAKSLALVRKKPGKETVPDAAPPDPRGRGGRIDVRR